MSFPEKIAIMSHARGEVVPVESRPWQTGLAPVYIGMFLWVAFFDQIGRRTLSTTGLRWPMLGALAAGPLCYLLLYRVPALWGQRTGRPLAVVATSTFGTSGARLVPGLLIAISQVAWFAVAVGYAVDLTFQGLVLGQFVDERVLKPVMMGDMVFRSPLFLTTALVWCIAVGLVGGWFVRWIAALMQIFPIFPALILAVVMLAMLTGLQDFTITRVDALTGEKIEPNIADFRAFLLTIQAIFAFTAMAGVAAADWGSASLGPKDVRMGGWFGVGLTPVIITILALVTIAGHQGKRQALRDRPDEVQQFPTSPETKLVRDRDVAEPPAIQQVPPFTFRAVLVEGFDRRLASVMLLVFGLAGLAPACYASFDFGHRFKAIAPGIGRPTWTVIGASVAWFLIVGGWFDRTDAVFGALGAAFAPVAGAMTADYRRHRGEWPGSRRGVNPSGLIAWGLGLVVGLIPLVGRAAGIMTLDRFQPASLWAFVTAFVAYSVLAALGLESGRDLSTRPDAAEVPIEST